MTDSSCEQFRDMLVDYADGELSVQDSQALAKHLAECPACRKIVRGLERSLHLAKAIWLDNLEGRRSAPAVRWAPCAAVAASIFIVVGTLALRLIQGQVDRTPTYAEIERQVTRTAAAARLLAATQLIAKCEGTESAVEQQYRYILTHYGDTPSAATIRNSRDLRFGEVHND